MVLWIQAVNSQCGGINYMAVTVGNGGAAGSNGSAGSIDSSSFTCVSGGYVIVIVVVLDNTISVSTLGDNSGSATYTLIASYNVSATLRLEYWRSDNPASKSGCIVTATLSASAICAIACNQYTGATGLLSGNETNTRTDCFPSHRKAMSYSADYIIGLMGFNGSAGDTITAHGLPVRRQAVGASGAAGVALVDVTQSPVASLLTEVLLNNSREWGVVMVGLQASSTPYPYASYEGRLPITSPYEEGNPYPHDPLFFAAMPAGAIYYMSLLPESLPNGTPSVAYSQTLIASGGEAPYLYTIEIGELPTGLALDQDTGVISGTPTTNGTWTFLAQATDALGQIVTRGYQIVIGTGQSGGGSGASYLPAG